MHVLQDQFSGEALFAGDLLHIPCFRHIVFCSFLALHVVLWQSTCRTCTLRRSSQHVQSCFASMCSALRKWVPLLRRRQAAPVLCWQAALVLSPALPYRTRS